MLSFLLIIIASLFFSGIINRVKSIASGRKGPGIFQPVKDIIRLFRKRSVISKTTSIIFQIAPSIYLASVIMAAMLVPMGQGKGLLSFPGDFVFFAYALAAGKFFNIISALDTGSSFEGMGSSRESLLSMLAEPAFFIVMGSLGLITGYTSFHEIFTAFYIGSHITYALAAITTFIFIMLCMIENSRMPVDDPKTHLELTMIHEVMILDNSGFDLGLIMYTSCLKFSIYGALITNLFAGNTPVLLIIPIFLLVQVLFATAIGFIESFFARFRMGHNAQFVLVLTSLSLMVFMGALMIVGKLN